MPKRTMLVVGEDYAFENELRVGFHFNFYESPMFGAIVSVIGNDGTIVSAMASHQNDNTCIIGLVVNDRMTQIKNAVAFDPGRDDQIDLTIDRRQGKAVLKFNNYEEIELPYDFSAMTSAEIIFGLDRKHTIIDVAPIELRDVLVFIDGQNRYHWNLKYHDTDSTSVDDISKATAKAVNPHWLLDDHTDWSKIYSARKQDRLQTAFDPRSEKFYIAGDEKIVEWSPATGDSTVYEVAGGFRPMSYSNHLLYDTITGRLLNYNLKEGVTSTFDFGTRRWSLSDVSSDNAEARYANHAFVIDDSVAYAYGGYGFFMFQNDLFSINLKDGTVREHRLTPEIMPLVSSSAAVVDGKLYVFGGRGNESGRQELPSTYRYAMYAYDTDTWQGEKLWELDSVHRNFIPTQTMYYDRDGDCFYVGAASNGGELLKVSRTEPSYSVVSTPIWASMDYHDAVFDLYRSSDGKHIYMVLDKRIDPKQHDYSIYTLSAPFIDDPYVISTKTLNADDSKTGDRSLWTIIICVLLVLGGGAAAVMMRRRKRGLSSPVGPSQPESKDTAITSSPAEPIEPDEPADQDQVVEADAEEGKLVFDVKNAQERPSNFDRSRSAISLLGGFNVRSKTGEDITAQFTTRIKNLLILLLLSCYRNEGGVKFQIIDETVWGDKDEKSAQNNRNVYMRKLRVLLEEVGNISISFDKGYFNIDTSGIIFDYREAMDRIAEINAKGEVPSELIDETLELLLLGPMLPLTHYDWLDKYKGEYSDMALEILNKMLRYELKRDEALAYRIAETISLHEPLSEDAMKVKCRILSHKKMVGAARTVYNKFCKEYEHSLGEVYPESFSEVCKADI